MSQQNVQVSIESIGQKWGELLTMAFVQNAQLEARIARLIENERGMLEKITLLERELHELRNVKATHWQE